MAKSLKSLFLNEKLLLCIIVLNAVIIFLQECGIDIQIINFLDIMCTFIFIIEMIVKHYEYGIKKYWSSGWNRLDGTLVILSLPSVVALFLPRDFIDLDFLLVLRVLRIFRFFRLVHAFPDFPKIAANFFTALQQSYAVMIGLLIMIFIFALIGCNLFRDAAPQYFDTPLDAIYSTFRLFTGEGWNEIPDTIAEAMGSFWGHFIRIYFCLMLVLGSVIGMSLLNSIFVDAMVSDNNDDVKETLAKMQNDIEEIKELLDKK